MGVVVRAAIANAASVVTLAPTATASSTRGIRFRRILGPSASAGRVRSTSTKITNVSVSTRNWVSARSGAPWNTKMTPQPYPVTPTSSTAANRLRSTVALSAAARMINPMTTCSGDSQSRSSGRSRAPKSSIATGTRTSVDRITVCVAGIEPRCVTAVSRTAKTSAP